MQDRHRSASRARITVAWVWGLALPALGRGQNAAPAPAKPSKTKQSRDGENMFERPYGDLIRLIDRRQKWTRHVCWRVFRHRGP
jgi:hypothetical protein